jgi:DNA polymerase
MTANLQLDSRQRAMLAEMGVRVWLPDAVVTASNTAEYAKAKQDATSQSADSLPTPTVALPVRKEPPLRLPVLSSPPVQAAGAAVRYVIGNLPLDPTGFDCVLLGEPCTGDADKLLTSIVKTLGAKVFVAQMVAATNEDVQITDQLKQLAAKAILALGPHATKAVLDQASQAMPFGKLRGTLHRLEGVASPIVVTYHPLQLLRQPLAKAQTWLDLKIVMKEVKDSK